MTGQHLIPHQLAADGADLAAWHRAGTDPGLSMAMVHGAGVDHREFLPIVDRIDAAWNIVLVDVRGHGESRLRHGAPATIEAAIEDLALVLAQVGTRPGARSWVLVGHSFGGNIAQEFAHRHPDVVRALVTIGSPGQHRTPRPGELSTMRAAGQIYRVIPWRPFARLSGRWSSRVPETRSYVRDCLIATGRSTYLQLGLSGFASVHHSQPSQLPTLLVRGEHDMPRALDAIYNELIATNPAASRVIIPAVSHQVMQDAPDALLDELNTFLRLANIT